MNGEDGQARSTRDAGPSARRREVRGMCDAFDENLMNEMECETVRWGLQKAY